MNTPSQHQSEWEQELKTKISKAIDIYEDDKLNRPNVQYGITPKEALVIVLDGIFEHALSQHLESIADEIEKEKDYKNGLPEKNEDYDCDCGYPYDDCVCQGNRKIDKSLSIITTHLHALEGK